MPRCRGAQPFAVVRKDGCLIRRVSGKVRCRVVETPGTSELPEGYRLDLAEDPDAPALRRPDGTVAARFSARGMTHEAIEREALEDLLMRGPTTRRVWLAGRIAPVHHLVQNLRPLIANSGRRSGCA